MEQVVLPTNIVKRVQRLSKELEAVKEEIRKAVRVPKSQAWFWSKAWQRKEKAADRAIKQGKIKTFSSASELIRDLHS
jgi:hypothetical protein